MKNLAKKIEHTKQAIANLQWAVAELKDQSADASALQPYLVNLAVEQSRLSSLLLNGK